MIEWILYFVIIVFIFLYYWLKRVVKRAVVQPIAKGKVYDPLLSEKTRFTVWWEAHGNKVCFVAGLALGLWFGYGV